LVVGMGISGIATAARLHRAGWTPVIIERAADRRSGGYFVALFGAGHAAARRLGILEHLHNRTSPKPGLDIGRDGRKRPGVTFTDLPGHAAHRGQTPLRQRVAEQRRGTARRPDRRVRSPPADRAASLFGQEIRRQMLVSAQDPCIALLRAGPEL
jgi:2-polyprenyl-6-methoxyphenol hydroxylase-like FAD-dependent oxidoreductase